MPINPFNYNIDYFDSVNLGPITDSNFLNYLVSHNLQNIEPEIANTLGITNPVQAGRGLEYDVSQSLFNVIDTPDVTTVSQTPSVYNNFTNPLDDNLARNPTLSDLVNWYPNYYGVFDQEYVDYKTQYSVGATLQLGFVGNVDNWFENGVPVEKSEKIITNEKKTNKYGPSSLISYDSQIQEVLEKANTGLIQYNTGIQGDFRDEIFNRTLGVGIIPFSTIGSGINYKPDGQNISELDKIARERRGFEVRERVRINFIDETAGILNLDPINLLAGSPLIQRDFAITRPANFIGRAAQFLSDLGGFSLPTSILQDYDFNLSIFNKDGSLTNQADPNNLNEIDVKSSLLNRTGKATRDLLFDNIKNNKYGPNFDEDYETKNEGTYLNLLAETPLEGRTEDQYGGFYGKNEPYDAVGRTFSEKAGYTQGDTIIDFNDYNKEDTIYNGTVTEKVLTPYQTGTIDEKFDWRVRDKVGFTKGILAYTQNLVNKSKRGDAGNYIGYFNSAEAFDGNETYSQRVDGYGHSTGAKTPSEKSSRPSIGNTVRNYNFEDNSGGEFYCRSWSSRRKYHTWNNLLRSEGNWWKVNEKFKSNMTMNWGNDPVGIPKIAYEKFDSDLLNAIKSENTVKGAAIPYMFSIENLAWKDAPQIKNLPECEKGPNGGRIMWFPPYDINFSESNSVNWDPVSFIGRGENIYTYNNTERGGSLDFTIIVDHSTVLNQLRDRVKSIFSDEPFHSFFAGCDVETLKQVFREYLPTQQEAGIKAGEAYQRNIENAKKYIQNFQPIPPGKPGDIPLETKIYFDQNSTDINTAYEITTPDLNIPVNSWNTFYSCATGGTYQYLNSSDPLNFIINKIVPFLLTEDGKNHKIKITGYASELEGDTAFAIAEERANTVRDFLFQQLITQESDPPHLFGEKNYPQYPKESEQINNDERWEINSNTEPYSLNNVEYNGESVTLDDLPGYNNENYVNGFNDPCNPKGGIIASNSRVQKLSRYVTVTLESNSTLQVPLLNIQKEIEFGKGEDLATNIFIEDIVKYFITECDYFESMKREQPFVYNSLQEKIKYFHPAFHSMTPEGLNSRITFLNQCTRQGPQTINPDRPQNMVFGRPPICVLRIGDFYNTKIVVDSININYEPLQWDLNPEGIGVQPMIAKVSMSFKFIGGSSLGGPISQLQNAVSYNFYSNTAVYLPANWEDALNAKQNFIYGSWLSQDDINAFYNPARSTQTPANVQSTTQVNNNLTVASNSTTNNAPISTSATTVITNSTPPSPPASSTSKPPSPPSDADLNRLKVSASGTIGGGSLTIDVSRKSPSSYDNTSLNRDVTFLTAKLASKSNDKTVITIDISQYTAEPYTADFVGTKEYFTYNDGLLLEEGYDVITLIDDKGGLLSGNLTLEPAGS